MRASLRAAAASLLGLAACTGPGRSGAVDAPPEDITWMGAIALDVDGRQVGATGLHPVDEAGPPPGTERAARMWLVGFTDVDLAAMGAPEDPAARASATLALAAEGDPRLPTPSWQATGVVLDGRAQLEATSASAPELTVAWLPECPQLLPAPTARVDASCRLFQCEATAHQDGCDVQFDLQTQCNVGALRGRVDGQGRLQFEASDVFETCQQVPAEDLTEGVQVAVQCSGPVSLEVRGCNLQVHASTTAPDARVTRRRIFEAPISARPVSFRARGYFGGLRRVGDELWLTTHNGASTEHCHLEEKGRLLVLDPETLETTREMDLPACPVDIAPLGEDMVLSVGGLGRGLLRIGPDGASKGGVSLEGVDRHQVSRMVVDAPARLVSVIAQSVADGALSVVQTFDADTFEQVWSLQARSLSDIYSDESGTLTVWDRHNDILVTIEPRTGAERSRFEAGRCTRALVSARRVAAFGGAIAMTSTDRNSSVTFALPPGFDGCRSGIPFGPEVHIYDPIGLARARFVVATSATIDPETSLAYLQRFDIADSGFETPVALGFGNPGDGVLIGDRAIVALPWAGELVAVDLD